MSARYLAEFRCLIPAVTLSLALLSHADAREVSVVVVPFFLPPPSPPQPAFRPEPELQWSLPFAIGRMPGLRSPTARCYARATVCPLARPEQVGEACTCETASGSTTGEALIPPSHDISGRPLRTD